MTKDIKKKLQEWAKTYHCADFIQNDPVQFPHRYRQKQDIETVSYTHLTLPTT